LSSIDHSRNLELINYLSDFIRGEKKRSAIYVTHDIEEALMIADRIVILKEGTVKSEYSNCLDAFPGAYGAPNSLRQKIISEISE
jgi:ABC-type molybdate transport system ATPase subunit